MAQLLDANRIAVSLWFDGPDPAPAALRVRWDRPDDWPADWLAQLYVNGELAAESADPRERELPAPVSPEELLAVQIVGVAPSEAGGDFSHLLSGPQRGRRALLRWPRPTTLPPGSTADVFGNGGAGEIDLAHPLNTEPIAMRDPPFGHGLGGFGQTLFGFGAAPSAGFAAGPFGLGLFGFDDEPASWLSDPLPPGSHRFAIVAVDPRGNRAAPSPEVQLTLPAPPPRVRELSCAGSTADGSLTLAWTNF